MSLKYTLRLVLAMLVPPVAASAQPLPRSFVSINMCQDQLLIDLGDRGKIMGLSPFARDPARSWIWQKAQGLPILSGTAEEIIMLKPDLVLADGYSRRTTLDMIRANGIAIEIFKPVTTVADVKMQILRMGELLGTKPLAQARIDAIDAALARLRNAAAKIPLRVLPLARRGWVAGHDSLVTNLLGEAGLTNAAGDAGIADGGFMNLEAIVQLRPDAIVINRNDDVAEDQGRAMMLHPALTALFPPERRIILPERLTVCGGPMLVEAIETLTRQIGTLKPRLQPGP